MPQINPRLEKLVNQKCRDIPAGVAAMSATAVGLLIGDFPAWESLDNKAIAKTFRFEDYYETMAFVNALALIAHKQNHHPDLEVGYNRCRVRFNTHTVGGLSENDFICAAKIEMMLQQA
jgi:4a-hydroxytetrahydrobiopterin dehydratase